MTSGWLLKSRTVVDNNRQWQCAALEWCDSHNTKWLLLPVLVCSLSISALPLDLSALMLLGSLWWVQAG